MVTLTFHLHIVKSIVLREMFKVYVIGFYSFFHSSFCLIMSLRKETNFPYDCYLLEFHSCVIMSSIMTAGAVYSIRI